MTLLVQKFGGSSVADVACMQRVAKRVFDTQAEGNSVVVVVSAMGKTTDKLVALAKELHADPADREYDMLLSTGEQVSISLLAMALHTLGAKAVSMTGPQAGIQTTEDHRRAKIRGINPERVEAALADGQIVIVAGFQGINPTQDITTLGRGGSDLTAVAMAAALKADRCQIFTDVDGVYTTDPRIEPKARKLDEIAYDEMLELASLGARVLQSRSVEYAKKYGVEIEVLTSFECKPGTVVKEEVQDMEGVLVRGIAADKNQVKITVPTLPDVPGAAANLFKDVAESGINVDMIVQNVSGPGDSTDITFTIPVDDVTKVTSVLGGEVSVDEDIAKVSIVGVGMRSHTGVAYAMFDALAKSDINIEMISTSEIKVSVVIRKDKADEAVRVLHEAFELA